MLDPDQAYAAARAIAARTLGGSVQLLQHLPSKSHHVFVGKSVVVKLLDAGDHARLDREIALGGELPNGLSARVLASGVYSSPVGPLRYACVERRPGASPGMGLPGVDGATAHVWAEQAVAQLQRLHAWTPSASATVILREHLDHGGYSSRAALQARLADVRALAEVRTGDPGTVPVSNLLDELGAIVERAPERDQLTVPVHADCHWDNWLVHDGSVTALLDFEWARFGEPADDWMFLARFSGPHLRAVLEVIATATATPIDTLRAACEVREIAHVSYDLGQALAAADPAEVTANIDVLREIVERVWWAAS